jgi:hypothetical protein
VLLFFGALRLGAPLVLSRSVSFSLGLLQLD